MKFTAVLASLVAIAAPALADSMDVTTDCYVADPCDSRATWHAETGDYHNQNVNDGCRNLDVYGMTSICVDWHNNRASFYFVGQNKRCMRMTHNGDEYDCPWNDHKCRDSHWDEVPCDW